VKVYANIKVANAQDRDKDRLYVILVDLQVFPTPGSSLVFKTAKDQRIFTVEYFSQVVVFGKQTTPPLVFLKPDHQTFKGASFENLCEKLERLGFTWDQSANAS
jgi:hypothetical protein